MGLPPKIFEITLRGHLDPVWAARLEASGLVHQPDGTTLLTGIGTDQAALHGVLRRVRDAGLQLVSVAEAPGSATQPQGDQP